MDYPLPGGGWAGSFDHDETLTGHSHRAPDRDPNIVLKDGTEEALDTPSGDSSGTSIKGSDTSESRGTAAFTAPSPPRSVADTGASRWNVHGTTPPNPIAPVVRRVFRHKLRRARTRRTTRTAAP